MIVLTKWKSYCATTVSDEDNNWTLNPFLVKVDGMDWLCATNLKHFVATKVFQKFRNIEYIQDEDLEVEFTRVITTALSINSETIHSQNLRDQLPKIPKSLQAIEINQRKFSHPLLNNLLKAIDGEIHLGVRDMLGAQALLIRDAGSCCVAFLADLAYQDKCNSIKRFEFAQRKKCNCSIGALMISGCKCKGL